MKKRQSRYSKPYVPKSQIRRYKYLTKVATTKQTKKRVPRWAVNKEFLKKFTNYMKQSYDAEIFLGRFDGSKQTGFSIAEMFNYRSKKGVNPLKKSSYFNQGESDNLHDPIDIRGSSANWNDERFTTAKRLNLPKGFFNNEYDSSRLKSKYTNQEELKEAGIKKKIEFDSAGSKHDRSSDDMEM